MMRADKDIKSLKLKMLDTDPFEDPDDLEAITVKVQEFMATAKNDEILVLSTSNEMIDQDGIGLRAAALMQVLIDMGVYPEWSNRIFICQGLQNKKFQQDYDAHLKDEKIDPHFYANTAWVRAKKELAKPDIKNLMQQQHKFFNSDKNGIEEKEQSLFIGLDQLRVLLLSDRIASIEMNAIATSLNMAYLLVGKDSSHLFSAIPKANNPEEIKQQTGMIQQRFDELMKNSQKPLLKKQIDTLCNKTTFLHMMSGSTEQSEYNFRQFMVASMVLLALFTNKISLTSLELTKRLDQVFDEHHTLVSCFHFLPKVKQIFIENVKGYIQYKNKPGREIFGSAPHDLVAVLDATINNQAPRRIDYYVPIKVKVDVASQQPGKLIYCGDVKLNEQVDPSQGIFIVKVHPVVYSFVVVNSIKMNDQRSEQEKINQLQEKFGRQINANTPDDFAAWADQKLNNAAAANNQICKQALIAASDKLASYKQLPAGQRMRLFTKDGAASSTIIVEDSVQKKRNELR